MNSSSSYFTMRCLPLRPAKWHKTRTQSFTICWDSVPYAYEWTAVPHIFAMRCLPLRPQSQMLICETAVLTNPGGGGGNSSQCFATAAVHFNFAGRTSGKQGQQFLYKLMTQDKDASFAIFWDSFRGPLQFSCL